MNLPLVFLLLNSAVVLSQTDQAETSNSEETVSSEEADSSSGNKETDNDANAKPAPEGLNSAQTDAENQSVMDSSNEESAQSEEEGSDEDGIAEIFIPTEEISEDIAVPFPVDI